MNDQMGLLRVRWTCPTLGGKCGSKHCFVQVNHDNHFLLEFHELESWAAAIVHDYLLLLILFLTFQSSKVLNMLQLIHLQIMPFSIPLIKIFADGLDFTLSAYSTM